MRRLTPCFCMPRMIFFVPTEQTGVVSPGLTPSTQKTTSCPAMASSTPAGSKMSPLILLRLGCWSLSASGLRSKPVTVYPSASACSVRTRPVPPPAPKMMMFMIRSLKECSPTHGPLYVARPQEGDPQGMLCGSGQAMGHRAGLEVDRQVHDAEDNGVDANHPDHSEEPGCRLGSD